MNPFSPAAGEGARTCTLNVSIDALAAGARRLVEVDITGANFDGSLLPANFEELSSVHFEATAGLLVTRDLAQDGEFWSALDGDNNELALLHAGRLRLVIENISGAILTAANRRVLLRGAARSPIPTGYDLPAVAALSGAAGEFAWSAPSGAPLASAATELTGADGAGVSAFKLNVDGSNAIEPDLTALKTKLGVAQPAMVKIASLTVTAGQNLSELALSFTMPTGSKHLKIVTKIAFQSDATQPEYYLELADESGDGRLFHSEGGYAYDFDHLTFFTNYTSGGQNVRTDLSAEFRIAGAGTTDLIKNVESNGMAATDVNVYSLRSIGGFFKNANAAPINYARIWSNIPTSLIAGSTVDVYAIY